MTNIFHSQSRSKSGFVDAAALRARKCERRRGCFGTMWRRSLWRAGVPCLLRPQPSASSLQTGVPSLRLASPRHREEQSD
ncbi:MAG: hypothetical protein LBP52_01495, partial [Burkholderiaceae bacterium]|nr:hypothetical protein [Burkholderiaceae bacterium]